jgi:type II secretory pathway pseudopilin PulG
MRADRRPRGLVLLAMLIFIAFTSLLLGLGAEVWGKARQREREAQLLFVGEQYRHAIESYWLATPGRVKALPTSLQDLLTDNRFPATLRHLRRLYPDPITGGDFSIVQSGPGIAGVYSSSTATPAKVAGFPARYSSFEGAASYDQWRFVFLPPRHALPVTKKP